jgi:glycosyltransferase involved in cell wall biosynthesis
VPPEQVPSFLLAGDAGLSFIKPCFSKISSSPTKIGEYLAMGLPVVTTSGIGDVDSLITGSRAGCLVREFSVAAYEDALTGIEKLLGEVGLKPRLRAAARHVFDLESVGGPLYRQLYRRLVGSWPEPC